MTTGTTPPRRTWWSNCYVYAVQQTRRSGGYVVLCASKWSRLIPWIHAMWTDFHEIRTFEPVTRKHRRWLPPFWFRGYERIVPIKDKDDLA